MHIHVGVNDSGCRADAWPTCHTDADSAARTAASLLSAQVVYYLERCETPCPGGEQCDCGACTCEWCTLARVAEDATAIKPIVAKLASGQGVRWEFTAPRSEAGTEIWAEAVEGCSHACPL